MSKEKKDKGNDTRAYPSSDANMKRAKNARAFPPSDDFDKNACSQSVHTFRIATWNLGSLTGRTQELAETLKRRNINICCVQETKWKGSKSRDLGMGYQLVYHGQNSKQNGVGIVLDYHLKNRIISIERKSDRLMGIKLALDNQPIINVICTYAPQVGCKDEEKHSFWEEIDEYLASIPSHETKFVMGDLNGHVGVVNKTYSDVHGSFGYGNPNKEGDYILEFASRHELSIINTMFKKKNEHLITYKSGGKCSQIDFILVDRRSRTNFKDCKVIPGESVTSQHRILVGVFKLPKPIKTRTDKTPRIKWKELSSSKGDSFLEDMHDYLHQELAKDYDNADEMWSNFEKTCKSTAQIKLGISKGGISNNKDPTWWDEDVKEQIKNKKVLFKIWQTSKLEEDHIKYKESKLLTKRKVAQARAKARQSFYDKIERAETDTEIFKIAKTRHRSTQDIKFNKYIKDKDHKLLTTDNEINYRWYQFYNELMNKEFPSQHQVVFDPVEGPVREIGYDEVINAVKRMKNCKAVGPDDVPSEIWKMLGHIGIEWLTKLFNIILRTKKMPESWRLSVLVPFYKNKGDVTQCANYRGIKLTSHTLKIWERVLNHRIQLLVSISQNQFGFTPSRSTTDAIQAVRILVEKHRMNREDLHLIFIDLEKAFDRVPRTLVWQALRAQQLPECYVRSIQDMYRDVRTKVRSAAGLSQEFSVGVGVHQGSALSPLLFNLVMDLITKEIQAPLPWNLLYADDIVLASRNTEDMQVTLCRWVNALENAGLRVSRTKTEHLACRFSGSQDNTAKGVFYPDNTPVPTVTQFKYLGSVISENGDVDADVAHRVNVAWQKWRSMTGVLCDTRMPIRTKGKVYKTAVRPAMMYGAECWAVKNSHVQKLHTAEMKMLRWSGGVTRMDRIRNEYIRGTLRVAPIQDKLTESRLRWYGHVMRRTEEHVVRTALSLPEGKRGRGRPPLTWWTSMTKLLKKEKLPDPTTLDRMSWRREIRRADPT